MKTTDQKMQFVQLRAEGQSYDAIAKALSISKTTCTNWRRELDAEIAAIKQDQLNALYEAYHMHKEARITQLGETISRIDEALVERDLSEVPSDKLLDLKLRYTKELQAEYIEPIEEDTCDDLEGLIEGYYRLYMDAKQRKYSPQELSMQRELLEKRYQAAEKLRDPWNQ